MSDYGLEPSHDHLFWFLLGGAVASVAWLCYVLSLVRL